MRKKVLITGNRGFVGAEMQKLLETEGFHVVGYDLVDGKDIRDSKKFESFVAAEKPDRILHLAAIARFDESDEDPVRAFETNGLGTANVAKTAAKFNISVVYSSTGSVYMPISQEPPITEDFNVCGNSVYACSKYLGELYLRKYMDKHTPWMILRYAHLYGKEKRAHGLIGNFIDRIHKGLAPVFYGGKQSNDFVYIKDVAEANYLALTASSNKWNQVYNIGTGEELTTERAGKFISEILGYEGEIKVKEPRIVDPERFVYDTSKAEKGLGFKSKYDFRSGLSDMGLGTNEAEHDYLAHALSTDGSGTDIRRRL